MSSEHPQQEHAARYAAFLRERFETQGMLAELAEYPNFVVWRYVSVDGQRKKPPFNPNTHQAASPTDRETWGTLESALHAVATGRFQGIGFMLSSSPFAGIDLDHCIEKGRMQPWAHEIITATRSGARRIVTTTVTGRQHRFCKPIKRRLCISAQTAPL